MGIFILFAFIFELITLLEMYFKTFNFKKFMENFNLLKKIFINFIINKWKVTGPYYCATIIKPFYSQDTPYFKDIKNIKNLTSKVTNSDQVIEEVTKNYWYDFLPNLNYNFFPNYIYNYNFFDNYLIFQKQSLIYMNYFTLKIWDTTTVYVFDKKMEFLHHKYILINHPLSIKINKLILESGIINKISEFYFKIINKISELYFKIINKFLVFLFENWEIINKFFDHLFVNFSLENTLIFPITFVGFVFIKRIFDIGEKSFDKLNVLLIIFIKKEIIILTEAAIYYWYVWFMTLAKYINILEYSNTIYKDIKKKYGQKIREFLEKNLYTTINPSYNSSKIPLYKLKFQIKCFKEKIFNKIFVTSIRKEEISLKKLYKNIQEELIFYETQKKLFRDIIQRIRNNEENFYPNNSESLFLQYIETIDHLIDELIARSDDLLLKIVDI